MIAALLSLAFLLGIYLGWVALPIVATIALVAILVRDRSAGVALLAIALCAFGCWRNPDNHDPVGNLPATVTSAEFRIDGAVVDDGTQQQFAVQMADGNRLCASTYGQLQLGRGDRIRADGTILAVDSLSGGFAAATRAKDCAGTVSLSSVTVLEQGSGIFRWLDSVRSMAAQRLQGWVPGDRGALLAGLVIGDDSHLTDSTADAFISTGTYHIVAISGANITLLIGLIVMATLWLPRRWGSLFAVFVIWSYVLIGGYGPPTIRAGTLATLVILGRALGRPRDLLTLTLTVAAVQAAVWPAGTLGLSYQLSTVAMVVVLLIAGHQGDTIRRHPVTMAILTSLAVNLALMPLLPERSRPSILVAVVANMLIAVPVALAFTLGVFALLVGLIAPPVGEALAILAGEINGLTIALVTKLAAVDDGSRAWLGSVAGMSTVALLVLAFGTILLLAEEPKRWIEDGLFRLRNSGQPIVPIVAGSICGTLIGLAGIVIMH